MSAQPHVARARSQAARTGRLDGLPEVARKILGYANSGVPRMEFFRKVSSLLLEFSGCSAVELRLKDPELQYCGEASKRPKRSFHFQLLGNSHRAPRRGTAESAAETGANLERLYRDVLHGRLQPGLPYSTRQRSFWTGDTRKAVGLDGATRPAPGGPYRSLALIRFAVNERTSGLLVLKSLRPDCFTRGEVESYETFVQTLGVAFANRRGQWALRERVKELTCLYGIAQVAQAPDGSLEKTLQGIVELLPPAWQYPEMATARVVLDGRAHVTRDFRIGPHRQAAAIQVGGVERGHIEVFYTRDKPALVEGPFLEEEQSLIDAVAREVSLLVERREAEEYQSKLQEQLRHADRLATIGQLAAGVAHELNEPLANILGFAQLSQKEPQVPASVANDLEKIVKTSLHAREIIHKLLVFARQMPLQKAQVNLNKIVEEGLYFLESRCAKAGIEVVRRLDPDLPEVSADPSQMLQVLVNLVVNAAQASPQGGKLTIETRANKNHISLVVTDTGAGMSEEVKKKIFTPFFTTKDVNEGTGLGLPVVHGIVTSHGGTIRVESAVGRGSRFEVQLPVGKASNGGARG